MSATLTKLSRGSSCVTFVIEENPDWIVKKYECLQQAEFTFEVSKLAYKAGIGPKVKKLNREDCSFLMKRINPVSLWHNSNRVRYKKEYEILRNKMIEKGFLIVKVHVVPEELYHNVGLDENGVMLCYDFDKTTCSYFGISDLWEGSR